MYKQNNMFAFKEDPKRIAKGAVLIAEPFTRDPHFGKSVVLITEHNENGTVGFVLNKPVNMPIGDLVKGFPDVSTNISIGGPVETNSIHFIHTLGAQIPGSLKINSDLYWGGDFEKLKQLLNLGLIDNRQVKFFVGYSGWKPKQLEDEIENNFWKITNLRNTQILSTDPAMWYTSVGQLGKGFKAWLNVPENPSWN